MPGYVLDAARSMDGVSYAVPLFMGGAMVKLANGTSQTFVGSFNTAAGSTLALGTSGAGAALTLNQTGTDTLNGVVSGNGSLTASNTGTTILGGTNTYSGTTEISGATLEAQDGTGADLRWTLDNYQCVFTGCN